MRPRFRHAAASLALLVVAGLAPAARAQTAPAPAPSAAPAVMTLHDALDRARIYDAQYRGVEADAAVASEERIQARAGILPSIGHTTQFQGTKGDTPLRTGRFVSNDGVQLYRSWMVVHEELSPNLMTPHRRATALEVEANARVEIARRGLAVTVTERYYALVTAERRYATAQQATGQAQRFFDIAQQQQRLGQVSRADSIKAEIQLRQREQAFRDATLQMQNARLQLAVLLSADLNENFTVVDDLAGATALPALVDAEAMAARGNPELDAALAALRAAEVDVRGATNAFLPSVIVDFNYGIEANAFALHSRVAADPELGVLPNLGYSVTINLSVPVWDWGALRSKLHQAKTKARQSEVALTQTRRELVSNLHMLYNAAAAARDSMSTAQQVAELAAESLRLVNLRYGAGEASALEVVDAQNTLVQARDDSDAATARYRVALAELQTVTGAF